MKSARIRSTRRWSWRAAIAPARAGTLAATGEATFDRYIGLITLRHAEVLLWMFIAGLLAMWPTDTLLFADRPELIGAAGSGARS